LNDLFSCIGHRCVFTTFLYTQFENQYFTESQTTNSQKHLEVKIVRFISRMWLFYIVLFIGLVQSNLAHSQGKIQLLDEKTQEPISDVYFNYGDQKGFSDKQGNAEISFRKGISLFLSHIRYGKSEINSEQVIKALKTGVLTLSPVSNPLMPVTFVYVHPGGGDKSRLDISVEDKLDHDAGNLLESVPSISTIRKSASYGFDPVLRGFKYDQINLVIDGAQSATSACPNRMDPASSQIPVNMISNVEVMKGPYSLRYGNAFGGTVNFKSSVPQFSEKVKPDGRLGTSYESNGNIIRTEGVVGITSSFTDWKVFGSYSKGNDYKDGNGLTVPAGFNRLNWGGKLGLKLGERQNAGIFVSNNRAKNVDFAALPMDLRHDNTWLVNASHSAIFYNKALSRWNTTVYLTHVDHAMDNFDKIMNPRMVDASTTANTLNYGGRSEMRFDFVKGYLFTGVDYRSESAKGERIRNMLMGPMAGKTFTDNVWQDAQIQKTGLFGEYHLDKRSFNTVFSGRLEYNNAKPNNPDENFSSQYSRLKSDLLTLSLSAGGTKKLTNSASLGLWLGRAQRSPGLAERYINYFPIGLDPYEMLGNPRLKPEINNQVDVIFQYVTTQTNLNIDLFTSFLQNYISSKIEPDLTPRLSTSPGVRRFVNIDKVRISGFEIGWKQVISQMLKHDLSIVYTYGINKKLDEPLPEIPPLEIDYSLTANFFQNRLLPEITYRRAFKQDRIAVSYGETKTPAFNVFDVKLIWKVSKIITATGGIHNIFDTAYYEHLARSVRGPNVRPIYSPGRSYYFTLTINFL